MTTLKLNRTLAATALAALTIAPLPARAFDFLPSADVGPVSWAGWIINPDFGFESMTFSGTGGTLLKGADGFYAGGYIERDFEWGPLVLGGSANIAYSWMDGEGAGTDPYDIQTNLNYFGLLRARAGLGLGRFLIYGTAGYAFGDLEIESKAAHKSASQSLSGTAAGAGLEFKWNAEAALKVEYLKIDFDEQEFTSLPAGRTTVDPEMDLWKIGFVKRY